MQNENVIQVLDKVSKLLQLGNSAAALKEVDGALEILVRECAKKDGKLFQELTLPQYSEQELKDPVNLMRLQYGNKLNEIIHFLNHRFAK